MINNVFTLVENFNLPIHKICLDSLIRHNPTAKIFTKESIKDLPGGEELCEKYKHLSLVHFSDLFRVWYILNFGGFWIDADCIHLRAMGFPYEMEDDNVAFIYDDAEMRKINQCMMYSKYPNNEFLQKYYNRQVKLIADKGSNLSYLDLGQWSIHHILTHEPTKLIPVIAPHWEYNYIVWFDKTCFLHEKDWYHFEHNRNYYNPNAYCYHITSGAIDLVKDRSYESILNGRSFLSFLSMRALTDGYEGTTHKPILKRLPEINKNYNYVEVGVYEGATAAVIAQQRHNAIIHCVDPWANNSSYDYKATNDYLAFSSDEQHQRHFETFKARNWFTESQGRLKIYRKQSQVAVEDFSDNSMDLVFIDADHSYSGVKQDINLWWNKVKSGGYLGGHDYDFPDLPFGVKKAVDEFVAERDLELELDGCWCWFIKKP